MPDDFLKIEETVSNLLNELYKIRSANEQIDKLEKISSETARIADNANNNSLQLITRGKSIFDQIEKAKLEVNLKSILEQLNENKRVASKNTTLLITVIVLQIIVLASVIILKFM
ncbi:MAG: hypothetical protein HND39_11920 [Ignavibacteriota bacterium]|jgi:hypothetical protein|nr:MAG: hypothetical protein EDM72_06370 [Chlorobiota bacterium]MBE7476985.1 hypothetical protein [Ignavibacteriales bacterium]MBL1121765.1 hypothetical protein [Ignavibacteriota bacterium]MCC7093825.1 hypothetical protein [Ignavibacteriaceae bacterium]MCE7857390.1 hypothetical protein [Ignavibacteria bacterium CHB3]MEB2295640.1 hypothetical protein [Ignavibacteria bacterium]